MLYKKQRNLGEVCNVVPDNLLREPNPRVKRGNLGL